MNKSTVVILVLSVVIGVFLLILFLNARGSCRRYSETQCRPKIVCSPFYEFGINCGEGGCKEGQRFKECRPRF